jgi:uncharacterized protein (DUF362 family)
MTPRPRAHITGFDPDLPGDLSRRMEEALGFIRMGSLLRADSRVFIKPNFTYPFAKNGVTTSPAFLEALVAALRQTTDRITIVESNGGANAWRADEAFAGHGVPELAARYGIRAMNLTEAPRETASCEIDGRMVTVELSSPMLHESDLFITVPVPKVHVMTGISLAFKNQWGCLPDVKRLRNHPDLPAKVLAVNRLLRTRVAVFDGTWFLDRTGPMDGDPVRMNLLVAADDPGAGSLACCEIMGIDPSTIAHKRLAMRIGMMPKSAADVDWNAEPASFRRRAFRLERTGLNYIGLAAFRSRLATWFIWDSVFAKPAHELLYLVRGRPKDMTPYW